MSTSVTASAQNTIRVSTDNTDLVMQVSPKGRLYQVYLGEPLANPADYDRLPWDVYAASDGSVCQRGHEVYATSGAEDFFEPAVAVTHADGNMTTYLYYQSSVLQYNAAHVILAHNHPRGRCSPSRADIVQTSTIREMLKNIDVRLVDHIIIAEDQWISLASR